MVEALGAVGIGEVELRAEAAQEAWEEVVVLLLREIQTLDLSRRAVHGTRYRKDVRSAGGVLRAHAEDQPTPFLKTRLAAAIARAIAGLASKLSGSVFGVGLDRRHPDVSAADLGDDIGGTRARRGASDAILRGRRVQRRPLARKQWLRGGASLAATDRVAGVRLSRWPLTAAHSPDEPQGLSTIHRLPVPR